MTFVCSIVSNERFLFKIVLIIGTDSKISVIPDIVKAGYSEWSRVGLLYSNEDRKPKTTTLRQLTIICLDFSYK